MSADDFTSRLQAAVASHIGSPGSIHDLQRLTGGATKTTWSFDAEVAGSRCPLILQLASTGNTPVPDELAEISTRISAEEDAQLMIAAVNAGVPAPRVRAILEPSDGIGHGYITERVAGEVLGTRIVRDEGLAGARTVMTAQCGQILAAIHRIDTREVPFLRRLDAAAQIEVQRRIVDYFNFRLPALELGLRWAADHAPRTTRFTVVHGDFRTGNMIVGPEGIRCLLDWEIALCGDPMQDLGWVCVKTWRFGGQHPVGGFGAREELFAAYEEASGTSVDPAHVRFWEAFGGVRWAVGCLTKGLSYLNAREEISLEQSAIGRRIEEPLWDFLSLIEGRD